MSTQVTYATDVMNQYTQVGGISRTHDNNGNLTDDGAHKSGYDLQNRLVELRSSSTSALIPTYRYDALGRRVEKALSGGATTRYVLDGVQVVEEYDGSNVWQARYVYEDGIDRPRSMDRADVADVNGNSNTTEVLRFYYHQQALGNVTEMTQPTGAVVEWVTYDAYGTLTLLDMNGVGISQSGIGNPYLYTGREYDPESGTYFYRARIYDPGTGRFLQRDPVGYVESPNGYEMGQSQPLSRTDALGLESESANAEEKAKWEKVKKEALKKAGEQDPNQVIKEADEQIRNDEDCIAVWEEVAKLVAEGKIKGSMNDQLWKFRQLYAKGRGCGVEDIREVVSQSGGTVEIDTEGMTPVGVVDTVAHELQYLADGDPTRFASKTEGTLSPAFRKAFRMWLEQSGLRDILRKKAVESLKEDEARIPEDYKGLSKEDREAEIVSRMEGKEEDLRLPFKELRGLNAGKKAAEGVKKEAMKRKAAQEAK